MSLHKSLRTQGTLKRARNVLSRAERIKILLDEGRWTEEQSVFGLPKVRQFAMKRRHKAAAKKEEGVPGAEGAAAPAAEGAAAAGAPAKGAAAKGAAPAKGAPAKGAAPAGKAAPAKGAKGKEK